MSSTLGAYNPFKKSSAQNSIGGARRTGSTSSGFNFDSTYGDNPWTQGSRQAGSMLSRLMKSYGAGGPGGSSSSSYSTHIARPGDQEVRDYMDHVLGGQRNSLDQYVKAAAGAGIQRSGMNVRGGPALSSSLHHEAMKTLAQGYGDRFSQAMNYNKYVKGLQASAQRDQMRDFQDLMNLQHRYLSGQANWQTKMGDLKLQAWQDQQAQKMDAPFRRIRLQQAEQALADQRWRQSTEQQDWAMRREQSEQQLRMQQFRDQREREQYSAAREAESQRQQEWGKMMSRSSYWGTPWGPADLFRYEKNMIEGGLLSPLRRSISLGGGSAGGRGGGSRATSSSQRTSGGYGI